MRKFLAFAAGALLASASGGADKATSMPVTATINFIDATGVGKAAGTITLRETAEGLELETRLNGLPRANTDFTCTKIRAAPRRRKMASAPRGLQPAVTMTRTRPKPTKAPAAAGTSGTSRSSRWIPKELPT